MFIVGLRTLNDKGVNLQAKEAALSFRTGLESLKPLPAFKAG